MRRALSHVGGAIATRTNDPALADALKRALAVRGDEERVLSHVHGFHSYPARLHPDTATTLIERLSAPGDAVLDPFCGSGTVPVAARELGRRAFGSDLNPLAVELSRLKVRGADAAFARELGAAAEWVAEHARERQKAKLGPTKPYGAEDRALFETYVLLALDGLRDGIDQVEPPELAQALYLVLSALLTKVSRQRGDSSTGSGEKRIARSFAFRFFVMKAQELAERLQAYTARLPKAAPAARIELADARQLRFLKDRSLRLVVSSPPYPGVYDYFEHHATRLRWLRLDSRGFQRAEIGARREAQGQASPVTRWENDFGACLAELARVLEPEGRAALVVADSTVAGRPYYADEWLPRLAEAAGLDLLAVGSQVRPHFHQATERAFERKPRSEHVLILGKPDTPRRPAQRPRRPSGPSAP